MENQIHTTTATAVSPFRVDMPDEALADLRRRIKTVYPNLVYFSEVDRGGHFAAWEEPQLFSEEVRAGFRFLR
jgi:pimeloyl-ACP methyl ester carboxylesterase